MLRVARSRSHVLSSVISRSVCTTESVNAQMEKLAAAQEQFLTYDQEKVDYIFKRVAHTASKARVHLAKMAVAETQMGCFEDKVIKNSASCELTLNRYLHARTVDVISQDNVKMLTKIAVPIGPVAAILPMTNPTSTVNTKSLFSLKTRNGMIFLPHPRAKLCTNEAVRICHDAAVAAGAPEGILQCVENPTKEISNFVMHHPTVKMLLATGGPAMVHACYESGKPSLGVGAGNAAILIDDTVDLAEAVSSIVLSKTFDNGMICASEQSAVILDSVYEKCRAEFVKRGMCILQGEDKDKLRGFMLENEHVNTQIIGQTAMTIASRIGVSVPRGTIVLGAEISEVGPQEPLSYEKLSPILTLYRAKDFEEALQITKNIVSFGGLGHTSAIYTHNQQRLDAFARAVPAFHLFANMPTSFGAIGTSYNFHVDPSLTLGVGSIGGSSISGSLTPFHLLDIKTVAEKQEHMEWYKNPPAIYFNRNCMEEALNDLTTAKGTGDSRLHRAMIVTDTKMVEMGFVGRLQTALEERGFVCSVFDSVAPDPDMHCIREGVQACKSFKPDTMVCIGGGSPMDAGKFIRVLYEHPDLHIDDLSARFVELRLRTNEFPEAGDMIHKLVCIPTTSGTASEVTPFSVVTDDEGHKQPIFSYRMTPDMAIIDSSFTDHLPKTLVAHAGLDAITHCIETYTAIDANDFTMPHALRGLSLLFGNLEKSYKVGDKVSRERVHHGASIAGLAFSNSYLGVCHSLSHKVGAVFHLPHGLVNAILLPYVMEYNAVPNPTRMGVYPSYGRPQTLERYAKIASTVNCVGSTDKELATALVQKMQELSRNLDVPLSFQALGVDEKKFMSKLRSIAEESFDDQCTPANPRFPLVSELEEVLKNAYYGTEINF